MKNQVFHRRDFNRLAALAGVSAILVACSSNPAAAPTAPAAALAKPTSAPAATAAPAAKAAPTAAPAAKAAPTQAAAVATKAPAASEAASLLVWDQFTGGGSNDAANSIDKDFQDKNPSIKVTREAHGSDLHQLAKTALASGTGPDVLYYDTGIGWAGPLQQAGLLLALDDLAKEYGWTTKIFKWALDRGSLAGKLYGLGLELEYLGMYFNQTLLDKEGWKPPQTDQEFTDFVGKAKTKGYIPDAYANKEGFSAYHQFAMIANDTLGADGLANLLFKNQGNWTQPDLINAVKWFFVDLNKAGAFVPDVNAVAYNDGSSFFYSGKALLHTTGTWLQADIETNAKGFDIKIQPFPSIQGKPRALPTHLGSAWYISSKTKFVEPSAKFLDFQFTPAPVKIWVTQAGFIPPVSFDPSGWNLAPLTEGIIKTLEDSMQGKGPTQGYYVPPYLPATCVNVIHDDFQGILAGIKTPQQQATDLQQCWDKNLK